MTLVKHELKQGRLAFIIWTAVISFMLAVCVFIYPEMKTQMDSFGDLFASMGSFSEAFGLDQLNMSTLVGYYAVECGEVLGLGGAFFACFLGISTLSKEERNGTAEFLLTQPISRSRIVTEKLIALILQVVTMNGIIFAVALGSMVLVGEPISGKELVLLHLAYLIMQLELSFVCFGLSAFVTRGSIGIGLGLGTAMYFLNLISNMTEGTEFLKYITPFGYCDGAAIVNDLSLNLGMILTGTALALAGICGAYLKYGKKDIR